MFKQVWCGANATNGLQAGHSLEATNTGPFNLHFKSRHINGLRCKHFWEKRQMNS